MSSCEFIHYMNSHSSCEFIYYVNSYLSCKFIHYVNSYFSCEFIHCMNSYSSCEFIHCMNSYSAGALPYFWVQLPLFVFGAEKVAKCYCSCPDDGNVHHHWLWNMNTRVGGLRLACNHVVRHDGFCSSCCLSKSKNKSKSAKEIWNKINSFFRMNCGARQRGLVIVHGLVALFLEVIALAIILLVVRLVVPCVLVIALTMIMASIVLMTMIRSAIVAIVSVALMVVKIFVATALLVA
jgi:hypothetical protein